jgi:hypothetical protein
MGCRMGQDGVRGADSWCVAWKGVRNGVRGAGTWCVVWSEGSFRHEVVRGGGRTLGEVHPDTADWNREGETLGAGKAAAHADATTTTMRYEEMGENSESGEAGAGTMAQQAARTATGVSTSRMT